jgi:hypothetical protein
MQWTRVLDENNGYRLIDAYHECEYCEVTLTEDQAEDLRFPFAAGARLIEDEGQRYGEWLEGLRAEEAQT